MPVVKCCREARWKPAREHHPHMLQVALAPAPVARADVDQRGGALLEAAAEHRQHGHPIAGAPDQRRLDEVVAEDVPAERGLAPEVRQPAMRREGRVRMMALCPQ